MNYRDGREWAVLVIMWGVVLVALGCTYIYRDFYEKGCCTSTTEMNNQKENRPYTHP